MFESLHSELSAVWSIQGWSVGSRNGGFHFVSRRTRKLICRFSFKQTVDQGSMWPVRGHVEHTGHDQHIQQPGRRIMILSRKRRIDMGSQK